MTGESLIGQTNEIVMRSFLFVNPIGDHFYFSANSQNNAEIRPQRLDKWKCQVMIESRTTPQNVSLRGQRIEGGRAS
jgi:hypothetical protein